MTTQVFAGVLLVVLPIAYNVLFTVLSRTFDYPDILRQPTLEVLTRFAAGDSKLVFTWWGFAMTAVLLAPPSCSSRTRVPYLARTATDGGLGYHAIIKRLTTLRAARRKVNRRAAGDAGPAQAHQAPGGTPRLNGAASPTELTPRVSTCRRSSEAAHQVDSRGCLARRRGRCAPPMGSRSIPPRWQVASLAAGRQP